MIDDDDDDDDDDDEDDEDWNDEDWNAFVAFAKIRSDHLIRIWMMRTKQNFHQFELWCENSLV